MRASQATRTAAALMSAFCGLLLVSRRKKGRNLRGRAKARKGMLRMIFLWQSQVEVATRYHAHLRLALRAWSRCQS